MPNIDIISDRPYLEDGSVKIAVYNTVHKTKYWQHAHNFYEFVYVIDGFSLHYYNGKTTLLTGGDLFAIYPGDVHAYTAAYNTNIYNILFYLDELDSFKDAVLTLPGTTLEVGRQRSTSLPVIHVELGDRRELTALLERMRLEREERKSGWELNLKAMLTSFLVMYSRLVTEGTANSEKAAAYNIPGGDRRGYCGYIYNVLGFIEENYKNDIGTAELAKAASLSPDYLTKQFKAVMSMTPVEYLRNFRIAKAMDLLKTTEMSVSDIAAASGFGSISLFSRVFKQITGASPASFRKE